MAFEDKGDRGFSILELLISIAALAVVLVAFAHAFRTNLVTARSSVTRISTDNLARSMPAHLTSRNFNDVASTLANNRDFHINIQELQPSTSGTWRPYKITVYRLNDNAIDFVYETIRLMKAPQK